MRIFCRSVEWQSLQIFFVLLLLCCYILQEKKRIYTKKKGTTSRNKHISQIVAESQCTRARSICKCVLLVPSPCMLLTRVDHVRSHTHTHIQAHPASNVD